MREMPEQRPWERLRRLAVHHLMAEKARLFGNEDALVGALEAPGPARAKAAGRTVRGFDPHAWQQNRTTRSGASAAPPVTRAPPTPHPTGHADPEDTS